VPELAKLPLHGNRSRSPASDRGQRRISGKRACASTNAAVKHICTCHHTCLAPIPPLRHMRQREAGHVVVTMRHFVDWLVAALSDLERSPPR